MTQDDLEQEELVLLETDDSNDLPPTDIVAYSELRSCADLFRMFDEGSLELAPDFQRDEVWTNTSKTRFIDSLIKQLPIPSLCFSYDYKTEHRQVIDGLQRISTIVRFLGDEEWHLSKIDDIDPAISGRSNLEFRAKGSDLASLYRRIQNSTLPITVLRCDTSKKQHQSYLFTIFHRLNTGGLKLNNQEIRNCIYQGSFNSLLKTLASHSVFRKLLGFETGDVTRFKVEELILRFFAYLERSADYRGRLARFLNDFMSDKRDAPPDQIKKLEDIANQVEHIIATTLPNVLDGRRRTLAVLESLLVGIGANLSATQKASPEDMQKALEVMLEHEEFSERRLRGGTADADRVKGRLTAATEAFSVV